MRVNRIAFAGLLVVVALVFQVSVLARLHLPGAVPDLMLLVVVSLALTYGPMGGSVVGFGAGLLSDLAPPADHAAGRYALVLCLVGYGCGLVKPDNGPLRSATKPMFVIAGAALGSTVLYAGVGALVGDTAARHVGLTGLAASALLYDLLLAPFTVPWIMALARKMEHDPLGANESSGTAAAQGWLSSSSGRGGRFSTTGRLGGTGRVRTGLLRGSRPRVGGQRTSRQRAGLSRSLTRNSLGKLGKRP
jgi:rod shape-determining protein MreD